MNKKIFLILFLAFLIRLIALDQSLWLDEATTARVVQEYGFSQIITQFAPNDFHPPLYYLFMKLWTNIFGYSEISLRMPSVLTSLLAGYLVYLLGKKMKNESTGVWAAAFFLFNPLIVYYSQEARMYMFTAFFLTAALYLMFFKNGKSQIFFISSIVLSVFTFYGSIFLIIPILLYLLVKKESKLFFAALVSLFLSFLILSPLFYPQLINAKESLGRVSNWTNVLGKANVKNLLLIPLKFSVGRISYWPKWLYWSSGLFWTGWVFFCLIKGGLKKKHLLFLFGAPIGFGLAASFVTPLLSYFRFLYLLPLMGILLSVGIEKKWLRFITVSGFTFFSLLYLLIPAFHREDWKTMAKELPGLPVYMIVSSSDPLRYYRPDLSVHDLLTLREGQKDRNMVIIPYTASIYGFNYEEKLTAIGYSRKKTEVFTGGLVFEYWEKER